MIGSTSDITNVMDNVEPDMTYFYVASQPDAAGTGDTMYEVWYGEHDNGSSNYFANAKLAWLAVPPNATVVTFGALATLAGSGGDTPQIYGRPTTASSTNPRQYIIGDAPSGSIFVTGYTVIEDGTTNVWFEINYNHRPAWVPASEVTQYYPVYG